MCERTIYFQVVLLLLCLTCVVAVNADSGSKHLIQGTVDLDPTVSDRLEDNDRLVFKLYHLDQGIEKGQTYRILRNFEFPFQFEVGPDLDMSRRPKWPAYIVEIYTDKDADVSSVGDGELFARSDGMITLGMKGLSLTLSAKP